MDLPMAAVDSRVWLPGIVECIVGFLSASEVAYTLRLVDKVTSRLLADFKTVRLSLPSPAHVFKHRWGSPAAFRGLTWQRRLDVLCLTAASGSIANLEVALANAGLLPMAELFNAAAKAGQLHVCKLLQERGYPFFYALSKAASGGHRHVCEWLLASGCPCSFDAVYAAACGGHEELVFWLLQLLRERNATDEDDEDDPNNADKAESIGFLLEAAAGSFNLAALQRLHQQLLAGRQQQQQQGPIEVQQPQVLDEDQPGCILAAAAGSSTPDWQAKVEWLEGLGYPRTVEACVKAATSLDDDATGRLQWLCSRGYPLDEGAVNLGAVSRAAERGDLGTLRSLMEQRGVRPPVKTTLNAACLGRLAMLQYLHASGVPTDAPEVARNAASQGHLPVVVWAVEALGGVTPDNTADLLDRAASSGNIQLMTWLGERGWAWGNKAIRNAADCGCEEALEWLVLEQGCPLPVDGAPYMDAASNGDLAMVRCLHRLGCPWGPNQLTKCIDWEVPVPALRCLVELGCPVNRNAAVRAAKRWRRGEYCTALLEWLREERQQ